MCMITIYIIYKYIRVLLLRTIANQLISTRVARSFAHRFYSGDGMNVKNNRSNVTILHYVYYIYQTYRHTWCWFNNTISQYLSYIRVRYQTADNSTTKKKNKNLKIFKTDQQIIIIMQSKIHSLKIMIETDTALLYIIMIQTIGGGHIFLTIFSIANYTYCGMVYVLAA